MQQIFEVNDAGEGARVIEHNKGTDLIFFHDMQGCGSQHVGVYRLGAGTY